MDKHLLRIFESRVEEQCLAALHAAQGLTSAVANLDAKWPVYPTDRGPSAKAQQVAYGRALRRWQAEVWESAQSFVVAVANLSKLLWGEGGTLKVQREPFRRALAVQNNSRLRPTTMRNHFEHFDERIDQWWATSPGRNMIDANIGEFSKTGTLDRKDFFRAYDPATGDLSFWGTNLNVPDICAEVERILERAATELDQPRSP